ncbi:MAG TPA: sigma-70 family RNA polymerase sigma factor [Polyangiaceae bacterium]|nr:sigma-70 family RNA polymerase sigma factor [Polyangiaceae bacterium]
MDVAEECRPGIQALVARILRRRRDDPDVEDCTHETFRRALEHEGRLRSGEPPLPWLLGIARHVALDALRAEYRRRGRLVPEHRDEGAASLVERVADPGAGPERILGGRQRAGLLRQALSTLPESQREALVLFHLEELDYQEIAQRLGVPVGTVGTWILRGRQALGKQLAELLGENVRGGDA